MAMHLQVKDSVTVKRKQVFLFNCQPCAYYRRIFQRSVIRNVRADLNQPVLVSVHFCHLFMHRSRACGVSLKNKYGCPSHPVSYSLFPVAAYGEPRLSEQPQYTERKSQIMGLLLCNGFDKERKSSSYSKEYYYIGMCGCILTHKTRRPIQQKHYC